MNITRSYTIDEAWARIAEHDYNPGRDSSHNDNDANDEWAGASWDEAATLLRDGWSEQVARIDVSAPSTIRDRKRPTPVWGVAGSEVDMVAYLSGTPDNMIEAVRRKRPAPVLRLGVDLCASSGVRTDRWAVVGRQVLMVVESLRLAGVPTELWACQAVAREGIYDLRIRVQAPEHPIDVSRVAFWVCHPAALRRIMLALEETEPSEVRTNFGFYKGRGYGRPRLGHARGDYDEWAPGVQSADEDIEAWARSVIERRAT